MPRSATRKFMETMREFDSEWTEPDPAEDAALPEIGLPDEEITT